jgi:hypothetical protein
MSAMLMGNAVADYQDSASLSRRIGALNMLK